MTKPKLNRLAKEHSLYLQQHADNPVDWYPWSSEAFAKAKQENKPILLSIGYSACHWCHVMAQESFSDPAVAKIMNELFVNIKVDREERPDIDKIYQTAHQLLGDGHGGWPLTVFLSPDDQAPFFTGTYFPPESRYHRPGFKDLLYRIAEFYKLNHSVIAQQNIQIREALNRLTLASMSDNSMLDDSPLLQAKQELLSQYDSINGGFGGAPKFPNPAYLERLLHEHKDEALSKMVTTSLKKMADGGIYDQIGGGFFRYSVDAQWEIPHFEKMLYDNAQLLARYAEAYLVWKEPLYAQVVFETITWTQREMLAENGGFYATLDADSEHEEGKYYYWSRECVAKILTKREFAVFSYYYNLSLSPNFEGHWHLRRLHDCKNAAEEKLLQSAHKKLLKARSQRVRPGRDEKILTAWNALMIKGLALAGLSLNQEAWVDAAENSIDFIHSHLWKKTRLLACYKDKHAYLSAYLDDYAFLLDALIMKLQVRWRARDLSFAIQLAEALLTHFYDHENGGFFFTANDHEALIQRPKPFMDEAIPAGNGVAAQALLKLGYLLGETRYLQTAENTLRTAWPLLKNFPSAHCGLLNALEDFLQPPQMIVLRGNHDALLEWQAFCQAHYSPRRLVFAIPDTEKRLPAGLNGYKPQKNRVIAYVCTGQQCLEPITELQKLAMIME